MPRGGWRGRREETRRQGVAFRPTHETPAKAARREYAGLQAEEYAWLWAQVQDTSLSLTERMAATRKLRRLMQGQKDYQGDESSI